MSKQKETGLFQTENGKWGYRVKITIDGHTLTEKKTRDAAGNPLNTKRDAIRAKRQAIERLYQERQKKQKIFRRTVAEVYDEYCAKGRADRAYQTKLKQDSLWKNHLQDSFGNRFVDDISVAEIIDYLTDLYCKQEYSFRYVESFLKMFYLIFGQAYSRNYLDVDTYQKLCVNKDTKIHMPKMKSDDDTEIVVFSRDELAVMDEFFSGTNAETAYLLGRYCGLRINECFGLKWENVDWEAGTILIDRQQQYQNGLIKLVPLKSNNGRRIIYLCDKLKKHLQKKWEQREIDEVQLAAVREQKQRFIEDLDGKKIPCTELVNCLPDGTIQTVNSMKYPSRALKARGIDFKYHHLRHTYGTMMAEMNTPQHLLCALMGHGNIHTTQRYYLSITDNGVNTIRRNMNLL